MTEESEEKRIPEQLDVLEENSSFVHDMHSHLAYGIHSSTTEFDHQKGLDEPAIMPIYSSISKEGFEDLQTEPKISIVSKTEEPSPRDADIVRCALGQINPRISMFSDIIRNSSPRDAGLVNPEILYSQKKEVRSLNSNTPQHSSCMSGIYVRTGKDVFEENCSFVHENSQVAYGTYSFTKDVQGKTLDESETEPVYSWNGFEDLQSEPNITTASKTKESSPRDVDFVQCTSKQGFEYLHLRSKIGMVSDVIRNSSPRDPRLVHAENLYALRKNQKSLNSSTDQQSSPRMYGNYVKTWKSPPKFRGTPIGALYASRLSNKVASYPHQEHYDSPSTSNRMYASRFSDRVPLHSHPEQFSSFRRSNSMHAARFSDSHQEQKYFLSRSNSHGSRLTNQSRNNDYKHFGFSNDQVRGPRASGSKSTTSSPDINSSYLYAQKDNYNKADFEVNYEQAKFFMIKSFSEDDIHRSVKYSVWASTPNGNEKLDAAFREAEKEKMEKSKPCPVFLFFSVNTSGQFVGLAEMIGPVDFKKDMDFWEQNKWNGFFPVKWHIVKDIPNRIFQHITLENNFNRAVTYSRDTQKILLPQGLSMLRIFKNYPLRTSILDDTDFYEKKEMEKEKSIPQHGGMNFDPSPLMHLESSFRNMSMSTRAVKPGDTSMYSPTSFAAKRRPFNNH